MKNSPKIIIGIISVLMVVLLAYVFFFQKAPAPQIIKSTQSVPKDWTSYNDFSSGLSLKAPAGLILTSTSDGLSLVFATTAPYAHTHLLREIRIDINIPLLDCMPTQNGSVSRPTAVNINGLSYTRNMWNDAGAGNIYEGIDYAAYQNRLCYRISFFSHSTNGESLYTNNQSQIKKVDAQQAKDMDDLFSFFNQVASTIRLGK
ncbi:TPA: hypothetical protein DCQ44_03260 [Candidatus Taylorbacteria bacterium]|nr:hypothetical protein [Candidatus Taylorbacteria bacterium]